LRGRGEGGVEGRGGAGAQRGRHETSRNSAVASGGKQARESRRCATVVAAGLHQALIQHSRRSRRFWPWRLQAELEARLPQRDPVWNSPDPA